MTMHAQSSGNLVNVYLDAKALDKVYYVLPGGGGLSFEVWSRAGSMWNAPAYPASLPQITLEYQNGSKAYIRNAEFVAATGDSAKGYKGLYSCDCTIELTYPQYALMAMVNYRELGQNESVAYYPPNRYLSSATGLPDGYGLDLVTSAQMTVKVQRERSVPSASQVPSLPNKLVNVEFDVGDGSFAIIFTGGLKSFSSSDYLYYTALKGTVYQGAASLYLTKN